jgi:hypothetical protein
MLMSHPDYFRSNPANSGAITMRSLLTVAILLSAIVAPAAAEDVKPLPGYEKTAQNRRPTEFQVYLADKNVLTFASEAEFIAADLPTLAAPCCSR